MMRTKSQFSRNVYAIRDRIWCNKHLRHTTTEKYCNGKGWYFRFDGDNNISYKYILSITWTEMNPWWMSSVGCQGSHSICLTRQDPRRTARRSSRSHSCQSSCQKFSLVACFRQSHWGFSNIVWCVHAESSQTSQGSATSMDLPRLALVDDPYRLRRPYHGKDDPSCGRCIFYTAAITISALCTSFCTHGLPDTIVSDNATCFTSKEFHRFCQMNGMRLITSGPHHPSLNGLAERAVDIVKGGIKRTQEGDMQTRLNRFLFH